MKASELWYANFILLFIVILFSLKILNFWLFLLFELLFMALVRLIGGEIEE